MEQAYKNKILQLEKENRELKDEYKAEIGLRERMGECFNATRNLLRKRENLLQKYIDKYGKLED